MGLSGRSDKNGQTANKDMDHSTLTLHTLSLFSKESGERAGEGREGGRTAGRSEESRRAAREGDEEIREMESQERRREREE